MSWLYRVTKYGGVKDSLDFSAREMVAVLSKYNGELFDQSQKLSAEVSAKHRTFQTRPDDGKSQSNLIKALQKAFDFARNQPPLKMLPSMPSIQQTINNAIAWHSYDPQGTQKSIGKGVVNAELPNVSLVQRPAEIQDGPEQWVRVVGLPIRSTGDQYENPFAKTLTRQLGKWIQFKGNDELLVRGSKQSWDKFL
jgi:hypothetical protein